MTELKLRNGEFSSSDVVGISERITDLLGEDPAWAWKLSNVLQQSKSSQSLIEELIVSIYDCLHNGHPVATMFLLDNVMRRRRSGLEDSIIRARLNLPAVFIVAQ